MNTIVVWITLAAQWFAWSPVEVALTVGESPRIAHCALVREVDTRDYWRIEIPYCEFWPTPNDIERGESRFSYSGLALMWSFE